MFNESFKESYEKYLLEARFHGYHHTHDNHYLKKVDNVGANDEYDSTVHPEPQYGPFMPYVDYETYQNLAEELTLCKAGLWNSNNAITGCVIKDDVTGELRFVKVRWISRLTDESPYYADAVIYTDEAISLVPGGKYVGDQIFTFMVGDAKKLNNRYSGQYVDELPEETSGIYESLSLVDLIERC